jgi:hypothetical protein
MEKTKTMQLNELQNLYFALTGQELPTIPPPASVSK